MHGLLLCFLFIVVFVALEAVAETQASSTSSPVYQTTNTDKGKGKRKSNNNNNNNRDGKDVRTSNKSHGKTALNKKATGAKKQPAMARADCWIESTGIKNLDLAAPAMLLKLGLRPYPFKRNSKTGDKAHEAMNLQKYFFMDMHDPSADITNEIYQCLRLPHNATHWRVNDNIIASTRLYFIGMLDSSIFTKIVLNGFYHPQFAFTIRNELETIEHAEGTVRAAMDNIRSNAKVNTRPLMEYAFDMATILNAAQFLLRSVYCLEIDNFHEKQDDTTQQSKLSELAVTCDLVGNGRLIAKWNRTENSIVENLCLYLNVLHGKKAETLKSVQERIIDNFFPKAGGKKTMFRHYFTRTLAPLIKREKIRLHDFYFGNLDVGFCENIDFSSQNLKNTSFDRIPRIANSTTLERQGEHLWHTTAALRDIKARMRSSFKSWVHNRNNLTNFDPAAETNSNLWIYTTRAEGNALVDSVSDTEKNFRNFFSIGVQYPFSLVELNRSAEYYYSDEFEFYILDRIKDVEKTYYRAYTYITYPCVTRPDLDLEQIQTQNTDYKRGDIRIRADEVHVNSQGKSCVSLANRADVTEYVMASYHALVLANAPLLFDFSQSSVYSKDLLDLFDYLPEDKRPTLKSWSSVDLSDFNYANLARYPKRTQAQFDSAMESYIKRTPVSCKDDVCEMGEPSATALLPGTNKIVLDRLLSNVPKYTQTREEEYKRSFSPHLDLHVDSNLAESAKKSPIYVLSGGLGAGTVHSLLLAIHDNAYVDSIEINDNVLHAAQDLSFAAVCEVYRLTEDQSSPFELASEDFYLPPLPATGHKCRSRILLGDSFSAVYTIRHMLHNSHTQSNSCSDTETACSSTASSFKPHRYHFVLQDIYGLSIARGTWDGSRLSGTSNADPERAGSYEQLFAVWDILVDGEGFGIWHVHEDQVALLYVESIKHVFGPRNVLLLRVSSNDVIIIAGRNVYYNISATDSDADIDTYSHGSFPSSRYRSITSSSSSTSTSSRRRRRHPCESPLLSNYLVSEILRSSSVRLPALGVSHRYALNCSSFFSKYSTTPSIQNIPTRATSTTTSTSTTTTTAKNSERQLTILICSCVLIIFITLWYR